MSKRIEKESTTTFEYFDNNKPNESNKFVGIISTVEKPQVPLSYRTRVNTEISDNRLIELASQYGTPFYGFEEAVIRARCRQLKAAITYPNTVIRYACKALTIAAILQIILEETLWIDASSINEVLRSLRAGFLPNEIVYTGESCSKEIYNELLRRKILINCTSLDALQLLGELKPGAECSVRINPGEGHAKTKKTNTGGPCSKHGIYFNEVDKIKEIAKRSSLKIVGIHSHIGSDTADFAPWLKIKDKTLEIASLFPDLRFVNLGGGLPVVYNPDDDEPMSLYEWGQQTSESMEKFSKSFGRNIQLQIEPGRFVVAESGFLLAEAQAVEKRTPEYNYVIVNTGLNHNIRPALYGSHHDIKFIPGDKRKMSGKQLYVVGGYLCESGDVFTLNGSEGELAPRQFPNLRVGDYMVMGNTGAYCHSMKSEYNSMDLPASILIHEDGSSRLIERRGTLDDLIRREV